MNKQINKYMIGFIAPFLAAALVFSGCAPPSCTPLDLGDPSESVAQFVGLMKQGKYAEAESMLDESVSLDMRQGLAADVPDMITDDILRFLAESYSVEFLDKPVIKAKEAEITFRFTSLSIALLTERLGDMVTKTAFYRMYNNEAKYDTEEAALELVNDVWKAEFSGDGERLALELPDEPPVVLSEFYTTRDITIKAVYDVNLGWRLVVNGEFFNALLGKS